jgi:NADH:ubiquinone oxidoreductase subunit 4 (subunit M)
MYWQSTPTVGKIPVNSLSRVAISALIIATIWLGIYPQPIFEALKR